MSSLRVLSVAYPFAPVRPDTAGGAEQVLASLDAMLVEQGHESHVIAAAGSQTRGKLWALPAPPELVDQHARVFVHARVRHMLDARLSAQRFDLVHLHGIDFWEYLPWPGHRVPLLATLHLSPDNYPEQVFAGVRADLTLCCVSRAQRAACPTGARACTVLNGVALDALAPVSQASDYVACLGRICPEKGYHLAIDAAKAAGLSLRLAGVVHPYATHRAYFAREIEPRLGPRHRYVGSVGPEARRALLSRARCLLVTSLVPETSCLVAMEALACGTPVIAFDRGALSEVVTHGQTGLLVDDPAELPHALRDVLKIDRAACRLAAERSFGAQRMHDAYLALYRDLVHGARHGTAREA